MIKRAALLATLTLFAAGSAWSSVTHTIVTTTSDGSPITGVTAGEQVIIDITTRTSGPSEALGLAISACDYDPAIVSPSVMDTQISSAIYVGFATGPGTGFGGLDNQRGGALPLVEETVSPGLVEFEVFAGVATTAAATDGSIDLGIVTGNAGDPQFRVVFDVVGTTGQSTDIPIGTFASCLDAYTGASDNNVTNASVTITVPEPASVVSSLAALGSVLGVVAIRRRA